MQKRPLFHVKKRTLLAVAGCVWLIAGFNVARLGCALALAGMMFWVMFVRYEPEEQFRNC